jgi:cysteine desulfurase
MIYLDHAATTPVAAEVRAAMIPFLGERFGNPSSIHQTGRDARAAVDAARDTIAAALGADYSEIHFTSSGTEADNLAVIGAMWAAPPGRVELITSNAEHHAVLHSARFLEKAGYRVTYLPVDSEGFVHPDQVSEAVTEQTALVSILHASNEIGTIQDVARLAKAAHAKGALFHTDAVQSFGSLPLDVAGIGSDMLSISAHKLYGPKGVGALYIRSGVKVAPIIHGGTQERERRAGTENTPGIAGFGAAVELMQKDREAEYARLSALRDGFFASLDERIPDIRMNGPRTRRLPNNVNVSISGVDGSALLMNLDREGICASSGSACSSGSIEPSHVLQALGLPQDLAASGIRFTLGRATTRNDLDNTVDALAAIVSRLRA